MRNFVEFDIEANKLEVDDDLLIPTFCKNMISEGNEKCLKHYKCLTESNNIMKCPYGFYSKRERDNIITCLVPMGCDGLNKIKRYGDKKENFFIMPESRLNALLQEYSDIREDNDKLHSCIHDLKNIGTYFNSMEFRIKEKYKDLAETDNDIKAMLELYNMMNYRLLLEGVVPEQGYRKKVIKLHSILLKLIIILGFKANNREISFNLGETDESIIGTDHLYLALFTLLDNAVKYSPPQREINIFFEDAPDTVTVSIENVGNIILDDEMSQLTKRGYRGKNNNTTGNGVGLAVFKEICDKCEYGYSFASKKINIGQGLFIAKIVLKKAKTTS